MRIAKRAALVLGLLLPVASLAAGSHDMVGCNGCHRAAPNRKVLNPRTQQPYTGAIALCFACHQDSANGGQGHAPISQHISHPFELAAVNPKVAKVPGELLREDGRFDCLGCHDPHPSNRNYRYLRVDVGAKGEKIDQFCGVCHPSKADVSARGARLTGKDQPDAPSAPASTRGAAPAKK